MNFNGYFAELFECALDGKLAELSDREKRLLANSVRLVLQRLGE